jgi:hypothetical protein
VNILPVFYLFLNFIYLFIFFNVQTHWQSFDAAAQLKTLVTLRDMRLKGKANVSPGDLKRELGLSHYQWVKWGR